LGEPAEEGEDRVLLPEDLLLMLLLTLLGRLGTETSRTGILYSLLLFFAEGAKDDVEHEET